MKLRTWACVSLLVSLAFTHADTAWSQSQALRIGLVAPLSGPMPHLGNDFLQGAMLYVHEVNAKGGIQGRKVEIVSRDSELKTELAIAEAARLVEADRVNMVLSYGHNEALSKAAANKAAELGVVGIGTAAWMSPTPNTHRLAFSIGADGATWGKAAAHAVAAWNIEKVAVVSSDSGASQEALKAFRNALRTLKPRSTIVDSQEVPLTIDNYAPIVSRQMATKPEGVVIFSALGTETRRFLRAVPPAQAMKPDRFLAAGLGTSAAKDLPGMWVTELALCTVCGCETKG